MPVRRQWYASAAAVVLSGTAVVEESAMIALMVLGLLLIAGRDALGGNQGPTVPR